jgi:hypothetical protein
MSEQQQGSEPEDDVQLDEEVMEDLDTSKEEGEDVKGGVASADPFLGRCGN